MRHAQTVGAHHVISAVKSKDVSGKKCLICVRLLQMQDNKEYCICIYTALRKEFSILTERVAEQPLRCKNPILVAHEDAGTAKSRRMVVGTQQD